MLPILPTTPFWKVKFRLGDGGLYSSMKDYLLQMKSKEILSLVSCFAYIQFDF